MHVHTCVHTAPASRLGRERGREHRRQVEEKGGGPSVSCLRGARALTVRPAPSVRLGSGTRQGKASRSPSRAHSGNRSPLWSDVHTAHEGHRRGQLRKDSPLASVRVRCPSLGVLSVPCQGGRGTHRNADSWALPRPTVSASTLGVPGDSVSSGQRPLPRGCCAHRPARTGVCAGQASRAQVRPEPPVCGWAGQSHIPGTAATPPGTRASQHRTFFGENG